MFMNILILVAAALAASVGATAEGAGGGDAYVRADTASLPDATWVLGTSRMERTLTLSGGRFVLTSFLNKAVDPPKEYVQVGGTLENGGSPEFSVTVNGGGVRGREGRLEGQLQTGSVQGSCQRERTRNLLLRSTMK